MGVDRLRRRLRSCGRQLCDGANARLAALWRDGVRPEQTAEAERLFRWLAEREAAEGTRLEAVLCRLPRALALAIRRELAAMLAEADADPRPRGR